MVIGHLGGVKWLNLNEWFPMYGYHMALFVFISGYFYKPITIDQMLQYVWKKTKRLLLPLFGWNIVYAYVAYRISLEKLVDFLPQPEQIFTLHNLFIEPFIGGHQYIFNLATWFVGSLFLVEVVYGFVSCFFYSRCTNGVQLLFYFSLGLVGTCLSKLNFDAPYWICIRKLLYFLFFFQLGRFYRNYWQPREQKWKMHWIAFIPIVLVGLQAGLYNLVGCTAMGSSFANFRGWILLPFIVGIIGIYFWVCISLLIEKLIPSNICEDFISTHTWDIMTHHLFVIFIINTLLVRYAPELINIAKYRSSIFYYETPIRETIYVFAALIIPLFWGYCKDNILVAGKHFYQSCRRVSK